MFYHRARVKSMPESKGEKKGEQKKKKKKKKVRKNVREGSAFPISTRRIQERRKRGEPGGAKRMDCKDSKEPRSTPINPKEYSIHGRLRGLPKKKRKSLRATQKKSIRQNPKTEPETPA